MKKLDKPLAIIFAILILAFLAMAFTSDSFFNWAYTRHQNQLSWYIRPIFIIPFCFFAYRHSWAGIIGTILFLLTSMFWFPQPVEVSDKVKEFLEFEKQWLNSDITMEKIILSLLVPISFTALGLAFWKRSLWIGLGVVVLMATGKIIWSVLYAGQAGMSIIAPAIIGLFICSLLIFYGFKRLEKRKSKERKF
jgi:hypothetical protein